MDAAAAGFIDAIPNDRRPLFDRFHGLVLQAFPDADVLLSYRMPTYEVGDRRLYVGVWKHGLSFYGWESGRNGGFVDRHPELSSGRATIRLPAEVATGIRDDELLGLIRAALSG